MKKYAARRAVFFDKDGTIVEDLPYNVDTSRIRFLPGTMEGFTALHAAGYLLFVITNQPGAALGYYTEKDIRRVSRFLQTAMARRGVPLAGYYFCPHFPGGTVRKFSVECVCRKPRTGLVARAAKEHSVDLPRSWLVGDILDDIETGRRAGCRTVFIDNGHETEWALNRGRIPHYTAATIAEAAAVITAVDGEKRK